MCVAFGEPDPDKLVARMGKWLPLWRTKFRVAPPGERWADQRHAEWMLNWSASKGAKFPSIEDWLRIKPVHDEDEEE